MYEYVSTHRIYKLGEHDFVIEQIGVRCHSAWSCIVYIDEYLSP